MVTTVYLIRHGRTALNAAGVLRGRIDEPLDPVGRVEAARLASLFASVPLKYIVSSPLERSLETARMLAEPHGLPVAADKDLADRDYGPWAGRSPQELAARYGAVDDAPASEVEPRARLDARVNMALKRALARGAGGMIAVVAHDAVNRALIGAFGAADQGGADMAQPTGCWNRIVLDGAGGGFDIVGAVPGDGTEP